MLTDPTRGLSARQPRGYHGPTALLGLQQRLFGRWTGGSIHPHEALTGLLTLVHGASNEELRGLTTGDIDAAARSVQLGRRPQPVPLDPATWAAVTPRLLRCTRLASLTLSTDPKLVSAAFGIQPPTTWLITWTRRGCQNQAPAAENPGDEARRMPGSAEGAGERSCGAKRTARHPRRRPRRGSSRPSAPHRPSLVAEAADGMGADGRDQVN